jgi:hypothetical protein
MPVAEQCGDHGCVDATDWEPAKQALDKLLRRKIITNLRVTIAA